MQTSYFHGNVHINFAKEKIIIEAAQGTAAPRIIPCRSRAGRANCCACPRAAAVQMTLYSITLIAAQGYHAPPSFPFEWDLKFPTMRRGWTPSAKWELEKFDYNQIEMDLSFRFLIVYREFIKHTLL